MAIDYYSYKYKPYVGGDVKQVCIDLMPVSEIPYHTQNHTLSKTTIIAMFWLKFKLSLSSGVTYYLYI